MRQMFSIAILAQAWARDRIRQGFASGNSKQVPHGFLGAAISQDCRQSQVKCEPPMQCDALLQDTTEIDDFWILPPDSETPGPQQSHPSAPVEPDDDMPQIVHVSPGLQLSHSSAPMDPLIAAPENNVLQMVNVLPGPGTLEPSNVVNPVTIVVDDSEEVLVADMQKSAGQSASSSTEQPFQKRVADDGIPEPITELPTFVVAKHVVMSADFHLGCEIDLKRVAMGARNAEYNPRRIPNLLLRLFDPRCVVTLGKGGSARIEKNKLPEDEFRRAARKAAAIVSQCGHPKVKCLRFRCFNYQSTASLRFPVRLEEVAKKWPRFVLYNSDICSKLQFKLEQPRCTLSVSCAGTVSLSGYDTLADAQEALRRTYEIFREFSQ